MTPPAVPVAHSSWLDWLRFLAALEVVLTHARTQLFVEYSDLVPTSQNLLVLAWVAVTRSGYEAVMVFFVLSGFLVGGRALELAREGKFGVAAYALDRSVRILIPLTAAIALTVAVAVWVEDVPSGAQVAGNLLSLQGVLVEPLKANFALWTLSYEVWFYILGGAVATMASRRRIMVIPALVLLAVIVVFTRLNPLWAVLWIGGAACYFYRPSPIKPSKIVVALFAIVAGVAVFQYSLPRGTDEVGIPVGWAVAGALILAGLVYLIPAGRAGKGIWHRPGAFLASFSYSLYLIHMPLLQLVPRSNMREVSPVTFGLYILTVGGIMAAAFVFSRIFETTAPAVKAFLRPRLFGPAKPAQAS